MELAFEYGEILHNKIFTKEWRISFRKKTRLPKKCCFGRITGFKEEQITRRFYNFVLYLKPPPPPDKILNADESGITSDPNTLPKATAGHW
jgi:hypothetical protein